MHRNLKLGLIGTLIITVAAAVTISLVNGGGDPPGVNDPTPTPTASPGTSPTSVGPTATSVPDPTATTAPPTPTATPEPPDAEAMARALLVSQGKARPSDLSLVSYERVTWPDASLGCPKPSMSYAQVETPGWRIILDNNGEQVEFHSDESGDSLFNCTERWAALEGTINVYEIEQLAGTTLIELDRFDFDTEAFQKINEIHDPVEIQNFLDVLNGPISPVEPFDCQPVFRLTFHTGSRETTISTICGSATRMIAGQAAGWNGMHGIAPSALGDVIGRNVPDTPIPFPPD